MDTREKHGHDGNWTYFNALETTRPQWSALVRSLVDGGGVGESVVIDVRGKKHVAKSEDNFPDKLFCETLVATLKQARANGVFANLTKPKNCVLCAEDTDSGFARSIPAVSSGTKR